MIWSDPQIAEILWLTLRVAVLSTLLTLPLAIALGYVFARKQLPFKAVWESFISLPLVAPPVVTGYLLLMVFGRQGWIGSWLFDVAGIRLSFNFAALVIASVVVSLPLSVRSIRAAFEQVNPAYETAARSLGASPVRAFLRVSLPLAWPGILSGTVLAFARSLGEFGATITLAGNIPGKTQTMSLAVYSKMQVPGEEAAVWQLVLISLAVSLLAMAGAEFVNQRRKLYGGVK